MEHTVLSTLEVDKTRLCFNADSFWLITINKTIRYIMNNMNIGKNSILKKMIIQKIINKNIFGNIFILKYQTFSVEINKKFIIVINKVYYFPN